MTKLTDDRKVLEAIFGPNSRRSVWVVFDDQPSVNQTNLRHHLFDRNGLEAVVCINYYGPISSTNCASLARFDFISRPTLLLTNVSPVL